MTTKTLLLFSLLGLTPCALAQSPSPAATERIVIPAAAQIDLTHTGARTHENFIHFDIGSLDLTKGAQPTLRAHCRLGTGHAALPSALGALAPLAALVPVPTSGPIERWGMGLERRNGRFGVRVLVPTRFANWVAAQPPALRRRYLDPRNYSLEIERRE